MVRARLRIATAEEEVTSSAVHWVSLMVQAIPVADQALRKRNIRQENIILTCRQRLVYFQVFCCPLPTWKYWLVSPQKRMMKRQQMVRPWILSQTGMGLS